MRPKPSTLSQKESDRQHGGGCLCRLLSNRRKASTPLTAKPPESYRPLHTSICRNIFTWNSKRQFESD